MPAWLSRIEQQRAAEGAVDSHDAIPRVFQKLMDCTRVRLMFFEHDIPNPAARQESLASLQQSQFVTFDVDFQERDRARDQFVQRHRFDCWSWHRILVSP